LRKRRVLKNGDQPLNDADDLLHGRGAQVRAFLGDFAKPDGWKVRTRFGRVGNRRDELFEFLFRARVGGGDGADALTHRMEHLAEDLLVERRLAVEVVVNHRLVDVGGAGDAVDVGAGKPAGGELGGGGGEEPLAAARFRLRGSRFARWPTPGPGRSCAGCRGHD
jgi:hypothetical protein